MEQDRPNIHRNVHPPILALGHIVGIFLLEQFVSFPFVTSSVLRYAGFALVVIGFLWGQTHSMNSAARAPHLIRMDR